MSLSNSIAWKYFFKRKNNHFINYISGLSILGLTIGITALLLVNSVFNGFEDVLLKMFSRTNPDLEIEPIVGKTFEIPPTIIDQLYEIEGIESVSPVVRETVLFEYENTNLVGQLIGVPVDYFQTVDLTPFKSLGELELQVDGTDHIILGDNLKRNLGVIINDPFRTVQTYYPNNEKNTFLGRQLLKKQSISPIGSYSAIQAGGSNNAYAPINYVKRLLNYVSNEYSAIEIKLNEFAEDKIVKKEIFNILSTDDITIKNQYQQDEDLYKLMNVEKWVGFAVMILTIILIAFNLVGCIWMIVIEKKDNFRILKAMGAEKKDIKKIVFKLGGLYGLSAIIVGTILTIIIYLYHSYFGLISMGEGYIVNQYPVLLEWQDFVIAYLTVLIICFVAAWPAAQRAANLTFREKK